MSLTAFPAWLWLLGLAVLAGLLFALQRLKVRHREQVVLTTLFWQEAKEEARARSLVERFRHPLAYLLALLLAGLAWLAFGDPVWKDRAGTQYTILLDGSQEMATGARFENAQREVFELASDLPRQRTRVVWCGAGMETLLAPHEERGLLHERLAGRLPSAAPSLWTRAVEVYAQTHTARGAEPADHHLIVVGAASAFDRAQALDLPAGVQLSYRSVLPSQSDEPESATSAGPRLAAFGVSDSNSEWGQVEVLLRVLEPAQGTQVPRVQLGDLTWKGVVDRERVHAETHYRLVGVPADGSELSVRFGDQAEPAGRLRLPLRAPIRVHVDAGVDSMALEQALRADPAVERVATPANADLRIVADGAIETEHPTLRLVPAADGAYAFFLHHDENEDSQAVLMQALGEFGLDRIDANEWATEAGRAIAIGAEPGPHRELHLWSELLDEDRFGFVESRAFPLMVGRAIRWLVDLDPIVPYLAAGDPVPQAIDGQGTAFASLSDWQPLQAGAFESARGGAWSASVLARSVSSLPAGASTAEPSKSDRPYERGAALLTWVLALAAGLVLLEWALYSRGQIP